MPVSPPTAYALLAAFGILEFSLKQTSGFLAADGDPTVTRANAKVDWAAVDQALAALPRELFLDRVSQQTRTKLLSAPRNRPMVQQVAVTNGKWVARFEPRGLPERDAEALAVAMRRVRNNLFHGGKEDPLEERHAGDDEEWAIAAREVAELVLHLLNNRMLVPPGNQ